MRKWRKSHPTIYKCRYCNNIIGNTNTIKYTIICDECRKRKCEYCKKEYLIPKENFSKDKDLRKFCSISCRISNRNKKIIWKKESREKLRQSILKTWKIGKFKNTEKTRENKRKANIGNKSHFWIDGRTPLIIRLRTTNKMIEWRKKIFVRDNYTCVLCQKRSKKGNPVYLQADHYPIGFAQLVRKCNITTFKKGIECSELWDINNGRTVCLDCHKLTDNFGNNGKVKSSSL